MTGHVADHVAQEAHRLTNAQVADELRRMASEDAHACPGWGCQTCWSVALMEEAASRLAPVMKRPSGPHHVRADDLAERLRELERRTRGAGELRTSERHYLLMSAQLLHEVTRDVFHDGTRAVRLE